GAHEAVADVAGVRVAGQIDGGEDVRRGVVGRAVAVGVGVGLGGGGGDAFLDQGDARGVGAHVDGDGRAGDRVVVGVGVERRLDRPVVGDRGQGAAEVLDGEGVGRPAAGAGQDRT